MFFLRLPNIIICTYIRVCLIIWFDVLVLNGISYDASKDMIEMIGLWIYHASCEKSHVLASLSLSSFIGIS